MERFEAIIDIIGVNPFVFVPTTVLAHVFAQARKEKGPIPVCGTIDGHDFIQTLVKYSSEWRLYINTPMLKACKKKVGEKVVLEMAFDPIERVIPFHPKLKKALEDNEEAKRVFESLAPSLQKEIVRYISFLKTESSVDRNVALAILFLLGKARFIGRDKPA